VPSPEPVLTEPEARRIVSDAALGASTTCPQPGHRVGVELEWLAVRLDDPARAVSLEAVQGAVAALELPGGSRVTFEPGGQIELSSPALEALGACRTLSTDTTVLRGALEAVGVGLIALGLEPGAHRDRLVRSPRYDAMEAFFDVDGDAGRTMMRDTAAIQINVDYGDPTERERRWRVAHDVGPVLAAAFANSPLSGCVPSGWRSTRLAVWFALDPGRSAPVAHAGTCPDEWARYALDASVMMVRRSELDHVAQTDRLAFKSWITDGHPLGWPTPDDVTYHLTTLFPPVRPRGWLELRMIDALPDPWWRAAVAVADAVITDPELDERVTGAVVAVRSDWRGAARDGLADPRLARAARDCFRAAWEVLPARGADQATLDATGEFLDRYVDRCRCPADDRLDAWRTDGAILPARERSEPAWT
jgi:ergothioneine biosynthesis glutamate--cysteine ligase EgtA